MKARFLVTAILIALSINNYSQTTEWEETPWGSPVLTWIYTEAPAPYRDTADTYYRTQYPNVLFLYHGDQYSSSDMFNCHGYVWYMSDVADGPGFSDKRRVEEANGTLPYISDNISYKVVTESEADIVWWSDGSHSALTTDDYRVWVSKWDVGPLVKHVWNDSPYGISNLVFYKRCFRRITGVFGVDVALSHCKVELENSSVSNYVDLEIEYEDWLLIDGLFSTSTGATLYFHPD
jgi:hypothetical protein